MHNQAKASSQTGFYFEVVRYSIIFSTDLGRSMDSAKQVRKVYESTVRIERLSDGMLRLQFNSGLSKQFWGKAQHKP